MRRRRRTLLFLGIAIAATIADAGEGTQWRRLLMHNNHNHCNNNNNVGITTTASVSAIPYRHCRLEDKRISGAHLAFGSVGRRRFSTRTSRNPGCFAKKAPRKSGGGGFGTPSSSSGGGGGLSDRAKRFLKKHKNNLDAATTEYFQTRLQELAPTTPTTTTTTTTMDNWETNQQQQQQQEAAAARPEDMQEAWRQARLAATWDAIAFFMSPQKDVTDAHVRRGIQAIAEQAAASGGSLLDVGCGDGTLVPFWKEVSDQDYVGMDVSQEMISLAQRQYGNLKGVDFWRGQFPADLGSYKKDNGKYGCILWNASWQFFPHNPLPQALSWLSEDTGSRFVVCHTQGARFVRDECRKNPSIAVQPLPTLEEWNNYAKELGMVPTFCSDDLESFHLLVMERP